MSRSPNGTETLKDHKPLYSQVSSLGNAKKKKSISKDDLSFLKSIIKKKNDHRPLELTYRAELRKKSR